MRPRYPRADLEYISAEVYQVNPSFLSSTDKDIVSWLKSVTPNSGKCRVLFHPNPNDKLHEMLINHTKGVYIRPHSHHGKTESFHIIEGKAKLIFFTEVGDISYIFDLEPYPGMSYVRIPENMIHSLVIEKSLVFIETTTGPLDKKKTFFPSWAPPADQNKDVKNFNIQLKERIKKRLNRKCSTSW